MKAPEEYLKRLPVQSTGIPYYSKEETITALKAMQEDHEKELIEFHIEVMKAGLIHEGDARWSDDYDPIIREVAEKVLTQFRNKQQDK